MLFLGWYDVATWHNVKSTLKQRCVRQRWNYNVEQRRIKVVHFNVDLNNVRQRRNNVVVFNVDFNNVVNMTIWKKKKASIQKQNNIFDLQRIRWAQNFLHFILHFKGNM